jgi:hypothetical protein
MIVESFWRMVMKPVALLVVVLALCEPAIAQTTDCQSVPKASDRLACYDKAASPARRVKPAAASPVPAAAAPAPAAQPGQPGDLLAEENARLDAKIKNICRGC